jgi:hypothetical protein
MRSNGRLILMFVLGVGLLGVLSALLLRSRPVQVVVPDAGGAAAVACARLAGELPATVAGRTRLQVQPPSSLTAAWGGAPIVLRCGVGPPAALQPTSELITIDGIDWLPEQVPGGSRYTTVGLVAAVEVTVPDDYQPAANALVDLGSAIAAADPALTSTSG